MHRTRPMVAAAIVLTGLLSGCADKEIPVVHVTQTETVTATAAPTDPGAAAAETPASPDAGGTAAGPAPAAPPAPAPAATVTGTVAAAPAPASTKAAASSSRCSYTLSSYPDLSYGARGKGVEAFQCLLRAHGASVEVDGIYGPGTRAAYTQVATRYGFQSWVPQVETHVWTLLLSQGSRPTLKRGSSGEAVSRLQRVMSAQGLPLAADGRFGAKTEAAVRTFQGQLGMEVDGVVDDTIWRDLQAGGPPTD